MSEWEREGEKEQQLNNKAKTKWVKRMKKSSKISGAINNVKEGRQQRNCKKFFFAKKKE